MSTAQTTILSSVRFMVMKLKMNGPEIRISICRKRSGMMSHAFRLLVRYRNSGFLFRHEFADSKSFTGFTI